MSRTSKTTVILVFSRAVVLVFSQGRLFIGKTRFKSLKREAVGLLGKVLSANLIGPELGKECGGWMVNRGISEH